MHMRLLFFLMQAVYCFLADPTSKLILNLLLAKYFIAAFHFSVSVMGGISGGGSL